MSSIFRHPGRSALLALACVAAAACGDDGNKIVEPPPEPTDPCTIASSIAMGDSKSGSLTAADCTLPDGMYGDRWEVTLGSAVTVQIDLRSGSFDAFLELRSSSGQRLAENDDWGSLDSRIIQTLAPGTYTIIARSLGPGQTGPYTLSVGEGADCSSEGDVILGTEISSSITSDDCSMPWGGYVDWWTLELEEDIRLRLDMEAPGFDEVVAVAGEQDEQWIAQGYWDHPSGHARTEALIPAGSWRVGAFSGPQQIGAYSLLIQEAPPCGPGTVMSPGATVQGTWDDQDCTWDGWVLADSLVLELDDPADIQVQVKSQDRHPVVILLDESGNHLAVGTSWETPGLALAQRALEPGRYPVIVFADDFPGTGSYEVTVTEIVCNEAGAVELGETVSGELDSQDCRSPTDAYRETWTFNAAAETPVQVDLTSESFDTYLTLRDAEGNIVAVNDDGGTGTNSRIVTTLAAGDYELEVSSFLPGETGGYALTVAAQSAGSSQRIATTTDPMSKRGSGPRTPAAMVERIRREMQDARGEGGAEDLRVLLVRKH